MSEMIHILHLEDDPMDAELVQSRLEEDDLACRITLVQTRNEFETALSDGRVDIILADYKLPSYDGMSALRVVQTREPEIPFLFVSGTMGEQAAIEALTQGATDYILKQNLSRLGSAVKRAIYEADERRQRRQVEKALHFVQFSFDKASVGIHYVRSDGRIIKANQHAARILGYSIDELTQLTIQEIDPHMNADVQDSMWTKMVTEGIDTFERLHIAKDGSQIPVEVASNSFEYENHEYSICFIQDITERKQAEAERLANLKHFESMDKVNQAIQRSNDLEQTMSEVLDIVLSIFNSDRAYLLYPCDPEAISWKVPMERCRADYPGVKALGLEEVPMDAEVAERQRIMLETAGPVQSRPGSRIIHPKKISEQFNIKSALTMAILPKIERPWQFGIHQCSHSRKWTLEEERLFQEIGRRIADGLTSMKAFQELRESEIQYRRIVETSNEGIWMIDKDLRVSFVNTKMTDITGYREEEMIGRPMTDFMFEEDVADHTLKMKNRRHGKPENYERRFRHKNGQLIWAHVSASPVFDAGNQFNGAFAMMTDITERKQAETQRLASLKFFESMDKVNKAIQGSDDPEEMMKELLDGVLSIFDCDRAFLTYPCDPESPTWTSPMERIKPEHTGILGQKEELPMDPQIADVFRKLLAADGPVAFGPGSKHALPEDVSKQFGIKSSMSMAIFPKNDHPWRFGIHQCTYARVWTAEEMRILEAIGRRLADALSTLLSHRELHNNEEFLDKVIEHIPNMLFVKDAKNLNFVRFNKAGEQLLGYLREDLIGKTDYDFFPEEKADFFTTMDRRVLNRKEFVDIPEETVLTRDHQERILHTKKIPILNETGEPQYLLGISEDITEQKEAQESIRKLSQAIEQSPVSIIITNVKGEIEFVNAKFTQVSGYASDEALGQNPNILKSGDTPDEEYKKLWKTIGSGGVWQGEFHNRKKNGELFWEQATIAPMRNADNDITHYVAVKEDITERKRLEEQLRQSQKMEAIGQLAGGVAHDFSNMLGVIIGYSELAIDRATNDKSLIQDIESIQETANRSLELTQQLLAFARKQTITPKILDLNKTVTGMIRLLRRLIGKSVDLVWRPGDSLGQIKMDPSQVDQILANLCVNARDAINGVGKVTIETQNATIDTEYSTGHKGVFPGEYVVLAVSDNGCGMDKKVKDKIFEPFYTTKAPGKGTGMGLATIYGIVKQNAGSIYVYSELGHGSTFKVYLPRHSVKTDRINEKTSKMPLLRGHETIILVEDERPILKMVKQMLEELGYTVLAFSKPREAIRTISEDGGDIDMVITDLIMPDLTGRDLLEKVYSLNPEMKYLYMSGYSGNVIAEHGVLEAEVNFIQKPFSRRQLAAKVRDILDGK